MIKFLFSLALCLCAADMRADLAMEQQFLGTNAEVTGHAVLKLHGDKMRMDQWDANSNALSVIIDLNTRDSFTLMPATKTYGKRSGADVQHQMANRVKEDEMNRAPALPVATGRAEKFMDFDAQIYTWSGAEGRAQTLWVVTNFPNFNAIRQDLAKLDKFDDAGPHRNAQPQLSLLPGMVVKSQFTVGKKTGITILVSVKESPLDPALFELPPDYAPWKTASRATNNAAPVRGK